MTELTESSANVCALADERGRCEPSCEYLWRLWPRTELADDRLDVLAWLDLDIERRPEDEFAWAVLAPERLELLRRLSGRLSGGIVALVLCLCRQTQHRV